MQAALRFLREHVNTFYRIIDANIAHCKEASPFLPFIEDLTTTPSDALIDQRLLAVLVATFKTDIQGNFLPETDKYPPTNEMMTPLSCALCYALYS